MGPDEEWDIRRKGRRWTGEEVERRLYQAPEKIEFVGGIFASDRQRLTVLAMLLENLGIDQALSFGKLADWKEAIEATTCLNTPPSSGKSLPVHGILRIAEQDALHAYGDLAAYRITLTLKDDGWHVDYELKDPRLKGGGPHYVVDPTSGGILSKRYEQ